MVVRFILVVAMLATIVMVGCQSENPSLPANPIKTDVAAVTVHPVETATVVATSSAKAPTPLATASTPTTKTVVDEADPSFQSCSKFTEPALEPVLANKNLCIQVAKPTSAINGTVWVRLFGPTTIDERNQWINEIGRWLQAQSLDPCGQRTHFLTMMSLPPLSTQVAGTPGEKAYFQLGGVHKPTFCPKT